VGETAGLAGITKRGIHQSLRPEGDTTPAGEQQSVGIGSHEPL
jgi:hypothetical protein